MKSIKELLKISFRNLGRHKLKTFFTVNAIAVSIFFYIYFDGFTRGIMNETVRNIIDYETGVAKIYSKKYFEKKDELPSYESFDNYKSVVEKLDKTGFVSTLRYTFTGSLLYEDKELPFLFYGVDTNNESKVLHYPKYISEGRFIESGKFQMVIGSYAAKELGVTVGESLNLTTIIEKKDESGVVKYIHQLITLELVGILKSPNPKINSFVGFIPIDILQDEMGLMLNEHITEIIIRKKDSVENDYKDKAESITNISKILKDDLPSDLILVSYEVDANEALAVNKANSAAYNFIIIFLSILAIIGVSNTILIASLQRKTEIAMLRAIGLQDNDIIKLFLFEAGFLGLFGSILGIILGCIINIFMVNYGIDLTNIVKDVSDIPIRTLIWRSEWNISAIVGSGIFGIIITMTVAIIPTKQALKTTIVEGLHFD